MGAGTAHSQERAESDLTKLCRLSVLSPGNWCYVALSINVSVREVGTSSFEDLPHLARLSKQWRVRQTPLGLPRLERRFHVNI